jgi:predicted pyridoxine 5'-phosphate oxidase superfamily flavin-nucleotide-binding protein
MMGAPTSDVAFTDAVKALQSRHGSRSSYAKMEEKGGWRDTVTDELAEFIAERDSFYLATATADGQPYIQHRGGPKGFLKVVDERTLAFADFIGNRQYISAGNLSENDKAYIFLMDYPNRRRIKVWGRARVVDDDTGQAPGRHPVRDRGLGRELPPAHHPALHRSRSRPRYRQAARPHRRARGRDRPPRRRGAG